VPQPRGNGAGRKWAASAEKLGWRRHPDSNRRAGVNWRIDRSYRRVRRSTWALEDRPSPQQGPSAAALGPCIGRAVSPLAPVELT